MEPLPSSVVANTPFRVKLKMVNNVGDIITTSLNSRLEVMVQVSYIHKWWERRGQLWLAQTDAVLGGLKPDTSVTNDKVIFPNFVAGVVSHYGVAITRPVKPLKTSRGVLF